MNNLYKYKQNKREKNGQVRFRTKNRFTIDSKSGDTIKLKSHDTSVTWYEYAPIDEIEEIK